MRLISTILCLLCFAMVVFVAGYNFNSIRNFIKENLKKSECTIAKKRASNKELKEHCDENKLLLQLARLYVVSPERIVLLLTNKSLRSTCQEVADVLLHVNATLADSQPLPEENLYVKLNNGLDYFNSFICQRNPNSKGNHITNYQDCLQELREDLIECEGPPDWFEKTNEAVVCQYYNDIVNCHYVKAAMLCGLKPARLLRTFSTDIMRAVVTFKCKVSKSLPYVEDPMPAGGDCLRGFFEYPVSKLIMLCVYCYLNVAL